MNSIENIKNSIKTKLSSIGHINSVLDFQTADYDGEYPVAIVTLGSGEGSVNANVRSLTKYTFNIDVLIERDTNFTPEKAERIAVELTDELTAAFRADTTLSGVVSYCDQLTWEPGYDTSIHNLRTVHFEIGCNKIETIS